MADLIRIVKKPYGANWYVYQCDTCGKEVNYLRKTNRAICVACSREKDRKRAEERARKRDVEIWNNAINAFVKSFEEVDSYEFAMFSLGFIQENGEKLKKE